ncbi:hypothetical protein JG687_00014703 [Phytophthora cactorum]|uniref:Uncharacterized protein n=1 Tax=Phytophthora cactorum TaxID=29920 RepID=A0A8T1TY01_9STRA|nr:hypothetical protein JG687_00014703 [Phytophthora cactorum]
MKKKKLAIRGDFQRKPRGTFVRVEFVKCCQDFSYSTRDNGCQYPGSHSAWILDGASIHRHPKICHFLRSIEYMFGYVKKSFQRYYSESSGRELLPFVMKTFCRFEEFNMARVFEHCGWKLQGNFDPMGPMSVENRHVPDI